MEVRINVQPVTQDGGLKMDYVLKLMLKEQDQKLQKSQQKRKLELKKLELKKKQIQQIQHHQHLLLEVVVVIMTMPDL